MKTRVIKLNKFEKLLWIVKNIFPIKVLRIFTSRLMMSICLIFCPKYTYLFSFNKKLPSIKSKINFTYDPLDDFILKETKNLKIYNKKKINEEVLVFFKKETAEFKKYQNKNVKKFLVNWESNTKGKNIFFSTASIAGVSRFVSRKQLPCFFVYPFYYSEKKKPYIVKNTIKKKLYVKSFKGQDVEINLDPKHLKFIERHNKSKIVFLNHIINYNSSIEPNPGSGTAVIIALLKIYKKVKVFGLDLYQKEKIYKKNFFQAVLSFSNHSKYIFYHEDHMENLIYQYLYIARLIKNKNLKVHGNIAKIDKQKKLISNLSKIIYN